jgi:hypothetical protein
MPVKTNPSHTRALIQQQIEAIGRLRGSGPNPFDYGQWDARTREVLGDAFGDGSQEAERYERAAGVRGRLPGVRGQAENMTLNIHGQWGILGRLGRAETVLAEILASIN